MKKLASLMIVAVLLVVSCVSAFAATGINDYEKKTIEYVKTAYVVNKTTITVPAEYITALENIFATVDMTEAQYNQVKTILDEALAFCKANNLQKLEDITAKGAAKTLIDYANKALGVFGYSVKVSGSLADADHGTLTIVDANGKTVAILHPAVITKTGADFTSAAFCGVAALAVLAAAGVSVKRFRKEADED
ncbi:MAG: hypothetical protein RRZ68_03325 [Oscillospiraceae bacterium]